MAEHNLIEAVRALQAHLYQYRSVGYRIELVPDADVMALMRVYPDYMSQDGLVRQFLKPVVDGFNQVASVQYERMLIG
jgi:hypothetical protein